jgi:type IV pilus assembly protein PilB
MVGEIRDEETAEMAFRAAQTGHLLLSTLHTNDAVGAVARLRDLGVDRNLIASSLRGVLAQRLVRRVCPECREEVDPPEELLREFFPGPVKGMSFYRGQGCLHCNYTGYRGRLALGELWVPGEADILLINKSTDIEELRESASGSTIGMMEDAMDRLEAGETNLEELIRMLPYSAVFRHRQKMAGKGKTGRTRRKTARKKSSGKKVAVA